VLDGVETRIVEMEGAEQHDAGGRRRRRRRLIGAERRRDQQKRKEDAEPNAHCFTQVSVDLPTGIQPAVDAQSLITLRVLPSADSVAVEVANSFPFMRMMVFA